MSDTVALGAFIAPLVPLFVSAASGVVAAAAVFAARTWARWTHQQLSADALAKVTAQAQSEAGVLVAAAANNLATAQISVGSPIVAQIVENLAVALPAELAAAGLTPDRVATLVTGEIGKLQAQMTRVAPNAPHA